MKLKKALGIRHKEVICLVGGGGKTTLMFALARELTANDSCVITTTTTRIMEPSPVETEMLIIKKEENVLVNRLTSEIDRHHHITVACENTFGKLAGITSDMAVSLAKLEGVSHLIIEADGAARRPLKAPRDYEPVIPLNTTLVIVMVGIDAFGKPLEERNIFRSTIAAELLQVPMGTVVSAELMAKLITLPDGIPKGTPTGVMIVPFINKIDLDGGLEKGREVARAILADNHPQIEYVLLGQAQYADPVVEILCKEKQ
jgi:probable selenium-dependent hydroxylase accessory protein YqeC